MSDILKQEYYQTFRQDPIPPTPSPGYIQFLEIKVTELMVQRDRDFQRIQQLEERLMSPATESETQEPQEPQEPQEAPTPISTEAQASADDPIPRGDPRLCPECGCMSEGYGNHGGVIEGMCSGGNRWEIDPAALDLARERISDADLRVQLRRRPSS